MRHPPTQEMPVHEGGQVMKPRVSAQEFPTPSVLVVFPSDEHRILLLQAIVQAGMIPLLCESSDEAREAIKDENIQVVVCEDRLPESALGAILKQTRSRMRPIPVIVTSRTGEWEEFLRVLRMGAFDYLVLPPRQDEVRRVLKLALAEGTRPTTEWAEPGEALISGRNPLVCCLDDHWALRSNEAVPALSRPLLLHGQMRETS
jgi:DNA-binding NtrC family response regulator